MKIRELLFTGLYSGYFPVAPGTAGTVVAMAIYCVLGVSLGVQEWYINLLVLVIMLYPSIILCSDGERFFGRKDPQEVVIDEIIGYWFSLALFPFSLKLAFIAFVLFRIFDIFKPFPARKLQDLKGGVGIMIDDLIAGVYTAAVIFILIKISQKIGFSLF